MSECAIGKGPECGGDCFSCCVHRVMTERDALKEQVARLEKYGRHEEGCARSGLEFKLRAEDYPCTCGLAEVLKGAG